MLRISPATPPTSFRPRPSQRLAAVTTAALDGPLVPTGEVDAGAFDPERSYLLPRFRVFYAELSRLRRVAMRDPRALLARDAPDGAVPDIHQITGAVSARLTALLEQLALDAARDTGGFDPSLMRQAQYAMAALADEVFLTTEWAGREAWLSSMVEQAMFGSQIAGEEIFTRIDRLLVARTAASTELAAVYFLLLGLGFQGRYRGDDAGPGAGGPAEGYRRRLYRFLYRQEPQRGGLVVGQAYAHTLGGLRPVRLAHVRRWALVLAVAIATYVAASAIVWHQSTAGIAATTRDIIAVSNGAPAASAR